LQGTIDGCDAFLVIYSVVDKASFTRAEYFLSLLQDLDLLRSRCCILVGNKIDLARSRAISSQGKFNLSKLISLTSLDFLFRLSRAFLSTDGKCLACMFRAKFVEVSVGINHNVDELLAGTLTQIRLKKEHCELQVCYIEFTCY
jgi:GTPase SAR1 family protein